ncbi:MAG: hypothetical protein AVDCRST_MAG75-2715, partial [uncultured Propionibacteriaceae bacterium]
CRPRSTSANVSRRTVDAHWPTLRSTSRLRALLEASPHSPVKARPGELT